MTFSFDAYRDADRAELLSLYARIYGPEYARNFERRWAWEFADAPAHQRFPNLVARREGAIVAHLGRFSTRLHVAGEPVESAFLTDLMADRARGGLASLQLIARATAEIPVCLVFGGKPTTVALYVRLGFTPVAAGAMLARIEQPAGAFALAASRWLRRRHPAVARFASRGVFALPGLAAAPFIAAQQRSRRVSPKNRYEVSEGAGFDARFDTLADAMQARFAVMVRRDARSLAWRYGRSPTGTYRLITAVDEAGLLAGAAVVSRIEVGSGSYGKIMECLYRDEDALGAVLDATMSTLRKLRVDAIVSIGLGMHAQAALRVRGFRAQPRARSLLVKTSVRDGRERVLLDPAGWYVSAGDGDEDFEETVSAPVPRLQIEHA